MGGSNGLLAPLSIAFSVSAVVWRGLRKVTRTRTRTRTRTLTLTLTLTLT